MADQKSPSNVVHLFPPSVEAVTELDTSVPGCMGNHSWFDFSRLEHQLVASEPPGRLIDPTQQADWEISWLCRFDQLFTMKL